METTIWDSDVVHADLIVKLYWMIIQFWRWNSPIGLIQMAVRHFKHIVTCKTDGGQIHYEETSASRPCQYSSPSGSLSLMQFIVQTQIHVWLFNRLMLCGEMVQI